MQMLSFAKARATLTNVHTRSEKHGDAWTPMADLAIKIEAGAAIMSMIDGGALALFREWRLGDPADLVQNNEVTDAPIVVRHPDLEYPLTFRKQQPGYTLRIEHGSREDESALKFTDVKVDRIAVTPRNGPVIGLTFRAIVDPEGVLEELLTHVHAEIELTLLPPKADERQRELEAA